MRTLARTAVVLSAITAAAVLLAFSQPIRELGRPAPGHGALVELCGPESKISAREFVRVTSYEDWAKLWRRHVGAGPETTDRSLGMPGVDFERCMVVAFFRGESTNTTGEGLAEAEEVDGSLRLRFDSYGYQTASFNGEDKGEKGHSFGIWILPRSKKAIAIEENVQDLIDKGPIWKEQARMEALK